MVRFEQESVWVIFSQHRLDETKSLRDRRVGDYVNEIL